MSAVASAPPRPAASRHRLLAGVHARRPLSLSEHLAEHDHLELRHLSLLTLLDESGLTGRGGAAFPTATKVRAVAAGKRRPVVVVNGAEGEPLSKKDKLLLRRAPHLVLDGAAALAHALHTRDVFVALSDSDTAGATALGEALRERRARKLDGRLDVQVVPVPDRYVSGQETALVQYLNGGPARPTFTPPLPYQSGVAKRPTLVQNVETVAQIALIARRGPEWFRALGTPAEPGTALFTVSGGVERPGVYEIPFGTPLAGLLELAGGTTRTPRAFLIGGYAGAWISPSDRLALDEETLRTAGGTLGVGAVRVLPEGACGLCESARIANYLAAESAGQCGPCVHGLRSIAASLDTLAHPGGARDRGLLVRRLEVVAGRGACRHPDGAVRLVASALRVFAPEIEQHATRPCRGAAA
jgi:NADH:ubiquinone oxidoreductase subunit F (NADH-binding)